MIPRLTTLLSHAAGNRTSVIDGSGTSTYTSNNLNQYTAAGTTSFSYDASGNMTADGNFTYTYDPENRLVKVQKSGGSPDALAEALDSGLTFTSGGEGGWQTEGDTTTHDWDCASGTTSDDSESWMQTTVTGAGTLSFRWKVSSEGNCDLLEFYLDTVRQDYISGEQAWAEKSYPITGTGTHTFKWRYVKDESGSAGQDRGWVDWVQWTGSMAEPDPNNWATLNYVYDASGRRIEKKYDGRTVLKYVYDGDHCIAEYGAGNDLHRKYVYGPGVDQPICMIEAAGSYAGTYYYHFDGLGSVVALTNSSGNTVEVYEYDVYGRVGASDASHPNRFMFTGREFDKETGLYYYRARYYNPQIGRFLQTDPVGYGAGMNLYRYCRNNPLGLRDPFGRDPTDYNDANDYSFFTIADSNDGGAGADPAAPPFTGEPAHESTVDGDGAAATWGDSSGAGATGAAGAATPVQQAGIAGDFAKHGVAIVLGTAGTYLGKRYVYYYAEGAAGWPLLVGFAVLDGAALAVEIWGLSGFEDLVDQLSRPLMNALKVDPDGFPIIVK